MPSTLTAGYYLHTQIAITLTSGSVSYYYQKTRNGSNGTSPTVVNNLTSTSTTSALSANQGRVLKEEIDTMQTDIIGAHKYAYNGSSTALSTFMSSLLTKQNNGYDVFDFKVKAQASWSPTGAEAWLKGVAFAQNKGYTSDWGEMLVLTNNIEAYQGHIDYLTNGATWSVTWKKLTN